MPSDGRKLLIKVPSALFATILLFGALMLLAKKLSIWGQIGSAEHFWMLFAIVYVLVLTFSGWFYAATEKWISGLVHAVLMLGIAGMVFYRIMGGILTSPGSDDPVAGIVAIANLLFIIVGVLAGLFGVGVSCLVFRKNRL